ncbi:MAG: hypothetical protein K6U14_11990 [Firmicutes bacterium]|nr:hypothetical protein [Alicyclobacillaceae bacterium]MCL6498333.1 hypothetical protein [Bacillota bacterium]
MPAHPPAVVFGGTASIPQGMTVQVQGAEGAGRGPAGARAPIGLSPDWRWPWVQTDQHYGLGTAAAFVADIARNRPWSLARELVDPADWAQVQAAYEHVAGQIQSYAQSAQVNWAVGGISAIPTPSTDNAWPFDISANGGQWQLLLALESLGPDGQPTVIPPNEWPPGPQFSAPGNWAALGAFIRYEHSADGSYLITGLDLNPRTSSPGEYFPILIGEPAGLVRTLQDVGVVPNNTLQWAGQTFAIPQGMVLRQ